ncbi:ABC transporter ATP-binding protein [Halococcoides cellulosivorans]|uniref:ABC transporter ATP-binding protein n=1 Tax=Halococcoides cellulosivorans TaxID=1679096 RepID=A0A2R4WZ11_9EURY|nr:ABC transporter ATP-binding protein [Halococcoides cellulosivorans]AWB26766.1 ABC transporter ATP-binding protein [Halococcoides cellulosivorans]
MSLLEVDTVTRRYGAGETAVEALSNVSLSVSTGETVAVIGPSGSGKSTLLNLVGLLDTPTEGTIHLDDRDLTDAGTGERTAVRRDRLGFVFQDHHLLPMFDAVDNVVVPTMWDRSTDREQRARELLDRVGLGDRLDHRPSELSGGQKQRVAIARALVNDPDLLLADEPTGNLDQDTSRTILDELDRLQAEEDVATVVVTHDEIVTEYADRTVELLDGGHV